MSAACWQQRPRTQKRWSRADKDRFATLVHNPDAFDRAWQAQPGPVQPVVLTPFERTAFENEVWENVPATRTLRWHPCIEL